MKKNQKIKEAVDFIESSGYNHPIIVKACSELYINRELLLQKFPSPFITNHKKSNIQELTDINYRHYEARRKAKLKVLAKFLVENDYLNNHDRPKSQMSKIRPPSKITRKKSNDSIKDYSESSINNLKKKIIKKIIVEENLKRLKVEEEDRRKKIEGKIHAKSCRNEKRNMIFNRISFEKQEKRIKEILQKKHKDLEEYEKNALSSSSLEKNQLKSFFSSFHVEDKSLIPAKKPKKIRSAREEDHKIVEKLHEIKLRLDNSAERAKQVLIEKVHSSRLFSLNASKVKIAKESLEIENENKNIKKLTKMKQKFMNSLVSII